MTTNVRVGDTFPDFELPDHRKSPRRLSRFTEPSLLDEKLGFVDGYPLILVFGRGFFCPRVSSRCSTWCNFSPSSR